MESTFVTPHVTETDIILGPFSGTPRVNDE